MAGNDESAKEAHEVAERPGGADEASLGPDDLGREVRLDPPGSCRYCGHVIEVASVVQLDGERYGYACFGCAVKT